jgi:hypothetical protein
MAFLDDTVTAVILSEDPKIKTTEPVYLCREPEDTNRFAKLTRTLLFYVREDPLKVDYPLRLEFVSLRAIDAAELIKEG